MKTLFTLPEANREWQVGPGRCPHPWLQLPWQIEIRTLAHRGLGKGGPIPYVTWVISSFCCQHQPIRCKNPDLRVCVCAWRPSMLMVSFHCGHPLSCVQSFSYACRLVSHRHVDKATRHRMESFADLDCSLQALYLPLWTIHQILNRFTESF